MGEVTANILKSFDRPFEVFFDGECPLCVKEINLIRWLDRADRIKYTDIAAPDFDAEAQTGLSFETLMARIHGRTADGNLIEGVEVFRQLYGRTFLRGTVGLTRLPGVAGLLRMGYVFFARYRLRMTNRCDAVEGRCVPRFASSEE